MVSTTIKTGGVPIIAAYGPMEGGFIVNPQTAHDQNLAIAENIFVDLVGNASAVETVTSIPVTPGQTFTLPRGFAGKVSVNAGSSGHRFSGIVLQPEPNYQPSTNAWPPKGPTTLTKTIPSYLYQEYNDDDNLQAFVDAFNGMAQDYVTWFTTTNLPIYTGLQGGLLDWVAQGLLGITRPALPSGNSQNLGGLNTSAFNTMVINEEEILGPPNYYLTSDDIFKRIITWHLLKGDGKVFNIRWLKRRIMRFLTGEEGSGGATDATYQVSITFGVGNQININLQPIRRFSIGGAIIGAGAFNTFSMNQLITSSINLPVGPFVPVFKAAVAAGVLELPFQFSFIVNT